MVSTSKVLLTAAVELRLDDHPRYTGRCTYTEAVAADSPKSKLKPAEATMATGDQSFATAEMSDSRAADATDFSKDLPTTYSRFQVRNRVLTIGFLQRVPFG